MSSTRKSGTENSISLTSTTIAATKLLFISTLATMLAFCVAIPSYASGSLPLGTIGVDPPKLCNPANGWYYYSNGGINYNMYCQIGTITCSNVSSNVADLGLTFGYLNPVGIVLPTGSEPNGVIVLHGGDGGVSPESFALTDAYFKAGYEVVQVAWANDWEMISDPMTGPGNIQNTACRPATFLNYVYQNIYFPLIQANTNYHGGMCALATSAGAAAVAYSLAYYGAGDYLDNVELLSGPVLSDIKQGCGVGNGIGGPVTVCDPNSLNHGYGCQLGLNGSTWALNPTFVAGAQNGVQKWTNEQSQCAVTNPTDPTSNADWLKESIVDQGTGATPTFTYSKTAMSAWLCRSVVSNPNYDCVAHHNGNSNYCPNNSSPQGQLFYQNIPSGTSNFAVYAVDLCTNAEAVGSGNVPGYQPQVFNGTVVGLTAITDDMIGRAPNIPAQCVRRHY
jgi:hypothetical protein